VSDWPVDPDNKTTSWKLAVWEALKRLNKNTIGHAITRTSLIEQELPRIVAETKSVGLTPQQTLSRVLQDLRADGVLLFDGNGNYRLSKTVANMPLNQAIVTEAQALVMARRGQGQFRRTLDVRWKSCCPLTGLMERELLRASHIIPWAACESESERIEPENGLLLSVLWDAAFDRRLVTFLDDGAAVRCSGLSTTGLAVLQANGKQRIDGLTSGNRERLGWHRAQCKFA